MAMQAEGLATLDPAAPAQAQVDDALSPLSRLRADPQAFGFFQAVRLLYGAHGFDARGSAARPGPVRFATSASLNFPTSELAWLDQDASGSWRMGVNFLGLTGPLGVLPRHYTEHVIALGRDKATQEFLDLFNHRALALFWRAWGKHRPEIGREFGFGNAPLRYVHHLVGLGTPALQARLAPPKDTAPRPAQARRLPGAATAYFSGLISQRPHGAAALSQVIAACVGAPVQVDSCVGTWLPVPADARTRLARQAHALGAAVLGRRFWDRQTTLRLRIGPLDRDTFARLLPRGALLGDVVELARFLTGLALDLRIVLVLRAGQTPPLRLGARSGERPQLGWNTWLSGRPPTRAANESQFHFSAMGVPSWR